MTQIVDSPLHTLFGQRSATSRKKGICPSGMALPVPWLDELIQGLTLRMHRQHCVRWRLTLRDDRPHCTQPAACLLASEALACAFRVSHEKCCAHCFLLTLIRD